MSSATNESHVLYALCLLVSLLSCRSLHENSWRADRLLAALSGLCGGLANGREQPIGSSTLLHKCDRPGGLCSSACLCVVMDAQDHDGALGDHPAQGCCGLNAIHLRHLDIHQHHVGREGLRERQRLSAGAGFPNDLQIRLQVEAHPQSAPHDGLIIDKQHANHQYLVC